MTPTREEWRPIPGWEGRYEASSLGQIRSLDRVVVNSAGHQQRCRGRVLQQGTNRLGKKTVSLSKNGRTKTTHVAPLVLSAFSGPRPEGMDCCHNNGVGIDDRVVNLRWDTKSENSLDVVRHGHHPNAQKTRCTRGHELRGRNLVPSQLERGRRQCLACHRAWATRQKWGGDIQALADEHYTRISVA